MDAIRGFFQKYNAIPVVAGRTGDRFAYEAATDAALIGHATADCTAWDTDGLPDHVRLAVKGRLEAIRDEMWKRMKAMRADAMRRNSEELCLEDRRGPNPTPLAARYTELQGAWSAPASPAPAGRTRRSCRRRRNTSRNSEVCASWTALICTARRSRGRRRTPPTTSCGR